MKKPKRLVWMYKDSFDRVHSSEANMMAVKMMLGEELVQELCEQGITQWVDHPKDPDVKILFEF